MSKNNQIPEFLLEPLERVTAVAKFNMLRRGSEELVQGGTLCLSIVTGENSVGKKHGWKAGGCQTNIFLQAGPSAMPIKMSKN